MSTDASQVTGIIARHDLKPITVVIRRQGRTFPIRLIPRPIDGSPKIGVYLAERQIYVTRGASMTARLGQAFSSTWQVLTVLVAGFVKLVTGQVPTSQMGGPVRIVSMTSEIAATGLASLLYWLALLSANLAVLNVIPFPGLDGGRLAFLLGEFLARGRRNIRVEQTINFIGLVVLMLFIGVLTVQDIVSLHP
jgi:regulator of sigma E protease